MNEQKNVYSVKRYPNKHTVTAGKQEQVAVHIIKAGVIKKTQFSIMMEASEEACHTRLCIIAVQQTCKWRCASSSPMHNVQLASCGKHVNFERGCDLVLHCGQADMSPWVHGMHCLG